FAPGGNINRRNFESRNGTRLNERETMENALLIGLSRQIALQHQMDAIANNLANVQTAGYKSDSLKFEELIAPVANVDGMSGSDGRISFVHQTTQVRDFSQGDIIATGNPLDVALNG